MATEISRLARELCPSEIYGPLGVGSNVDHRHVLEAMVRARDQVSADLLLYEEQPYASTGYPGVAGSTLADAVRLCPFALESAVVEIDFEHKCRALKCFRTQLRELFGADLGGLRTMENYSRALQPGGNPAERLWRVRP
jgi:hypothetical protein